MLRFLWISCSIFLLQTTHLAHADVLSLPPSATQEDLNPNIPQPYIVKKGDTLWDIAHYFFKDPYKWLKVWEQNLYITNPDLIYPGNEIWFRPKQPVAQTAAQPEVIHRPVTRIEPQVITKPVERLTNKVDNTMLLTTLVRQDFINPDAEKGIGYVLGAKDERINFGINDFIYIKSKYPLHAGDMLDIFRTGDVIHDPNSDQTVGVLINHVGKLQILSEEENDLFRSTITHAFSEISRGDRLKVATDTDLHIQPIYPNTAFSGKVLYIQNNGTEAGQNQVIGITLGLKDGVRDGMVFSVQHPSRTIVDQVNGNRIELPEEKVAEIILLKAQRDASLALITNSTDAVHINDTIRNGASH